MSFDVKGFGHYGSAVANLQKLLDVFEGVLGFRSQPVIDPDEAFASGGTGVPGSAIRVAFVEKPGVNFELLEYLDPDDRTNSCAIGAAKKLGSSRSEGPT